MTLCKYMILSKFLNQLESTLTQLSGLQTNYTLFKCVVDIIIILLQNNMCILNKLDKINTSG